MKLRSLLLLALPFGCGSTGPVPTRPSGESTGVASTSTTDGGDPGVGTSSTSASVGTTTGADDTTGDPYGGFVDDPDLGVASDCSILRQDCPAGFKCMTYNPEYPNSLGGHWGCFPVAEDPVGVGEACSQFNGPGGGLDDCPRGAMCWDVDPRTNEGYCLAFCIESEPTPVCDDPQNFCVIAGDASFGMWCFPACDPRLDECGPGEACIGSGYSYVCGPDSSGDAGAVGDPCDIAAECDPGLACADGLAVPDCQGAYGCCSAYCTVGDDSPCLPEQTCQPVFDDGAPHHAWEGLGVCSAD
ncbi:MAG: hypothetical protein AAF799_22665 [Myxococcota bacterium]